MRVKYVGHGDMISSDWMGKRYIFSKRRPIVEIPDGLYDYIKSSNFIMKQDIVFSPVETVAEPIKEAETLITGPVQALKKRGRPKKG